MTYQHTPDEEESLYHEEVIIPLAQQDFNSALVIIEPVGQPPYVRYMADDIEVAIDLAHKILIILHEQRRQADEKDLGV